MRPNCVRCVSFSGPAISMSRSSAYAMMACSGVRNSCEMVARNAPFARFSASTFRPASVASLWRRPGLGVGVV